MTMQSAECKVQNEARLQGFRSALRTPHSAFTLIELTISLALVLLLLVGLSKVFSLTSDATGTNQALSDIVRGADVLRGSLGFLRPSEAQQFDAAGPSELCRRKEPQLHSARWFGDRRDRNVHYESLQLLRNTVDAWSRSDPFARA